MKQTKRRFLWLYRYPRFYVGLGTLLSVSFLYSNVIYEIFTPPTVEQIAMFEKYKEERKKKFGIN